MTKADLVKEVCAKTDYPQGAVKEVIDAVFKSIPEMVTDRNALVLKGFGTFKIVKLKQKRVCLPNTPGLVVPERAVLRLDNTNYKFRSDARKKVLKSK